MKALYFFMQSMSRWLTLTAGAVFFFALLLLPKQSFACFSGATTAYNSWSYCKTITISHTQVASSTGETYANFPVLVSEASDGSLAAHAQTSGNDILFVASDDITKLSHEVEHYASSTGELEAWVKLPGIATSTDTVFNMYYGNASVSNQQQATSTWNSNYAGVWHFPNGPALGLNDSTINSNIAGIVGSPTAGTGKIDGAVTLTNSNSDYVSVPSSSSLSPTSQITLSAWVKTSQTTNASIINKHDDSFYLALGALTAASGRLSFFLANRNSTWMEGTTNVADGNLHYVAATFDGTNEVIYVDGLVQKTENHAGALATGGAAVTIGSRREAAQNPNFTNPFNGPIDEVRVSNTARSADWLSTEYNNQNSPASFETIGSNQTNPNIAIVPGVIPSNHSGHITLTLTAAGSSWTSSSTVFSVSGAGVAKVSQTISSPTSATLVVTTAASTGTLTVTETVTGSRTGTVAVAAPSISVSPNSEIASTTATITLTGVNTVWTQETAAGLFTVSGGAGASIGTPTINSDNSATVTLTAGTAAGTITITDGSTGATTTVSVSSWQLYYNSFDGQTVGVVPTGFTNIGASSVLIDNGSPISGAHSVKDNNNTDADISLLTSVTPQTVMSAQLSETVHAPNGSNWGGWGLVLQSDATAQNYYLVFPYFPGGQVFLYKHTLGGGLSQVGSAFTYPFTDGQRITLKASVNNGSVSIKIWAPGGYEPAASSTIVDGAPLVNPGYAGVRYSLTGTPPATPTFDDFFMGVNNVTFTPIGVDGETLKWQNRTNVISPQGNGFEKSGVLEPTKPIWDGSQWVSYYTGFNVDSVTSSLGRMTIMDWESCTGILDRKSGV
jgi:hypothetical protein